MDFHLYIEASKEIKRYFNEIGISFNNENAQEVISAYFHIKHKMISREPRNVFKAKHIDIKIKEQGLERIIQKIENAFKHGDDINPYLSKGIIKPNFHDYLLNDWSIKHLHLNDKKDSTSDYFNTRADYLLFVHIDGDNVYFIDIMKHKENNVFSKKDFFRIVSSNWKELDEKFLVGNGEMQVSPNLDEEEIKILRKKGYTIFTQVDNKVYFPGQGSVVSGHSMEASREMDKFHAELYEIQKYIDANSSEIKKKLELKHNVQLDDLSFTMKMIDGMFYLFEERTGNY